MRFARRVILSSLDEYIKQYLLDPDLSFITKIKICLHSYVTADLILQLELLIDSLNIHSFEKCYTLRLQNQYE
jgi:hypothetical protein